MTGTPHNPGRSYRFYDAIMVSFVTVLICSEFMAAGKVATIGGFNFGAGVLFFPLSYLFGDILTEVYGYRQSRKVIWAGFFSLFFCTAMTHIIVLMPPSSVWPHQAAWETVFANSWRIVAASLIAFLVGEWANSVVLAKMKIWSGGRHLWMRTIGSTAIGELVDSALFYMLAFYGIWPLHEVIQVAMAQYVLKTAWEVLATPLTYWVVGFLKRKENQDYYDIHTNFTPFRVKV